MLVGKSRAGMHKTSINMLHSFHIEDFVVLWVAFEVEFIFIGQAYHFSTPPHDELFTE